MLLQVKGLFHCPLTVLNKASCIIDDALLESVMETCWSLLLCSESDTEGKYKNFIHFNHQIMKIFISGCCAAALVVASVRTPSKTSALLTRDLNDPQPYVRVNAILKIQVLWRSRFVIINMETACFEK